MTDDEKRAFIGPVPKTQGPIWVTPFKAEVDTIRDGNGDYVGSVTGDQSSPSEDEQLAELIATLLNRYADDEAVDLTPEPEFAGRVIVRLNDTIDTHAVTDGYAFAYEVAPGQFWFAASRAQAITDVRDSLSEYKGWKLPRVTDEVDFASRYVDVVTGELVWRED
jgi:hypothetical protein